MSHDRHDRHASGEGEGQCENQRDLFHDKLPLMIGRLPELAKAIRDRDHDLEVLRQLRHVRPESGYVNGREERLRN